MQTGVSIASFQLLRDTTSSQLILNTVQRALEFLLDRSFIIVLTELFVNISTASRDRQSMVSRC